MRETTTRAGTTGRDDSGNPRRGRRAWGVQPGLERLYGRLGARILDAYGAACAIVGIAGAVIGWGAGYRYLGLSLAQALSVFALLMPVLIAFSLVGLIPSLRQVRTILAWSGPGRGSERALETWKAIVDLRVVITRFMVAGSASFVPFAIYVTVRFHEPWWGVLPIALGPLTQAAALWVLLVALADLWMRPMLRDVASFLPSDFEPRPSGMRLGTKAIAPLPLVTLYATAIAGAYGTLGASGAVRVTLELVLGVATVALATLIWSIISRSVLAPIDELIAAHHRVRAGDLDTPLPVLTDDELGTLAHSFNTMIAGLREREALHTELRASRARIVTAADHERQRLERDLHDGAQQHLVLLGLKLGMARRTLDSDPQRARAVLDELRQDLDRALRELRDLAHGIYPAVLENEGLAAALRDVAHGAAIPTDLDCDGVARYPADVEAAIYFCCAEALQNAAKHAGPDARVNVLLTETGDRLEFAIRDTGHGFQPSTTNASAGLQNMTDRIGALGGTLEINSAPGKGTTVTGTVPIAS
jgi:signal transduction histidine kinase